MYNHSLHTMIADELKRYEIDVAQKDYLFFTRYIANAASLMQLFMDLYQYHPKAEASFKELIQTIIKAYLKRSEFLKERDIQKSNTQHAWFLSNQITGMSLYVDRFCDNLKTLQKKLDYFEELGVNFLHLMPLFESPTDESDGGYAVSNFRKIDKRFGDIEDLQNLQQSMQQKNMYLMLDIVLNHTSQQHEWAQLAKAGDETFQSYYYFFNDRRLPDQYELTMPEIFPESSPGNFTFIPELNKWVMTVFHNYQWDLNYTNPKVFIEMMDTIFFYANLGVDILRIDAPAFIWKQLGTTCQNLPQAHQLLCLIKQCVQIATPGMALLGEAIVAPKEIMKYFGTGLYTARECDFAYNATQMALQWDMLATTDTRVMLAAQDELKKKPFGTSWITYTRCHDDIGLGYEDRTIEAAGYNPYEHRKFIKNFYAGNWPDSPAKGALFGTNPKTGDARISGTLASLCGLEKAIEDKNERAVVESIQKIILMQAHSFFIGGIPMIYYGDEVGYTNDYSYLFDESKSYDNRWMHRPIIDWAKNNQRKNIKSIEGKIFSATQKLIQIRREHNVFEDLNNIKWMETNNKSIAGFIRYSKQNQIICLFNFNRTNQTISAKTLVDQQLFSLTCKNLWNDSIVDFNKGNELIHFEPYEFKILKTA